MIIDENKIKEYVNYHDWVYCPNEWLNYGTHL